MHTATIRQPFKKTDITVDLTVPCNLINLVVQNTVDVCEQLTQRKISPQTAGVMWENINRNAQSLVMEWWQHAEPHVLTFTWAGDDQA